MKKDINTFIFLVVLFLLFYFMPIDSALFTDAIISGFKLLNECARQHVLTCLVPAFFIAGAISVFVKKDFVLRYLGGQAKKYISYSCENAFAGFVCWCLCCWFYYAFFTPRIN
jgi:uncharacterized membrane protein YraQ (UPF0718 family)